MYFYFYFIWAFWNFDGPNRFYSPWGGGELLSIVLLHRLSTSINCLQKHIEHIRQTKIIFVKFSTFFFSPETTKQVIQRPRWNATWCDISSRSALKEINIFLKKNIIFDPSIYTMDHILTWPVLRKIPLVLTDLICGFWWKSRNMWGSFQEKMKETIKERIWW